MGEFGFVVLYMLSEVGISASCMRKRNRHEIVLTAEEKIKDSETHQA
jgi:hypothetical protein